MMLYFFSLSTQSTYEGVLYTLREWITYQYYRTEVTGISSSQVDHLKTMLDTINTTDDGQDDSTNLAVDKNYYII